MHIQSMRKCIYLCMVNAKTHETCVNTGVAAFQEAKKNPHGGGFYLTAVELAGVHAPPEDVTEDDDLFILHFLEGVVLVRVLIAVEAA